MNVLKYVQYCMLHDWEIQEVSENNLQNNPNIIDKKTSWPMNGILRDI